MVRTGAEPSLAYRLAGFSRFSAQVDEVYRFYTVPASNTAVGHIILENRKSAGKAKKPAGKIKRAAARAKIDRVRS